MSFPWKLGQKISAENASLRGQVAPYGSQKFQNASLRRQVAPYGSQKFQNASLWRQLAPYGSS